MVSIFHSINYYTKWKYRSRSVTTAQQALCPSYCRCISTPEARWVRLDREACRELKFWAELRQHDRPFQRSYAEQNATHPQLFYDASKRGFGGVDGSSGEVIAGVWTGEQRVRHITELEALAAVKVTQAFLPRLAQGGSNRPIQVELVGDSMAVVQANQTKRSKSWAVHQHVRDLLELGIQNGVELLHSWTPTEINPADQPSRLEHTESFKFRFVTKLCQDWHMKLQVDRFASFYNRVTPSYNSLLRSPDSRGDAFLEDWSHQPDGNWWNPPFSCLDRVISKILREGPGGILILPVWKSKSFWQLVSLLPIGARRLYTGVQLYENEAGELLDAPPWATLAVRVQYTPR